MRAGPPRLAPPTLLRFALALLLLSTSVEVSASSRSALLQRAEELELWRRPTWEALVHVVPRVFGLRRTSEIPTGAFFLARNGRGSPAAELRETLKLLLQDPAPGDEAIHCRFPARTRWLAEQLDVPLEQLAPAPCPELDIWHSQLAPHGITLIFAEAFMNNPASMFGHTLLRLDVADPDDPQNLLAYAIDFTASAGDDGGAAYILKGVFGRYPGIFGLSPFYEKLAIYAEWQRRDIWEYPLDLSEEEIERLLLHLWELRDVSIPYYFFRQNCSYQLLRVLAVTRPGLDLGDGFPYSVVPVDTVRDTLDHIGLSGEARYRPSPATELRTLLRDLDPEERGLALTLASGEVDPNDDRVAGLPVATRAAVLGTAYEVLRYEFLKEENPDDATQTDARERSHALLVARSRAGRHPHPSPPRPTASPDEGHGTALVSLGGGVEDDSGFVEIRVRPALHGLLQPKAGFPGDATLSFLDTRVRYFPSTGRVRLEEVVLLELRSDSPRDDFFKPLSWGLETGVRTRLFPDDGDFDRALVWRTGGSLGLTWRPGEGPLTLYARGDAWLEVGSGWEGSWALGPGVEFGVELTAPNDRWKGRLFGRGAYFVAGDRETELEVGLGQRLTLTRTTALVAEASYRYFAGESWLDASLSLQWTF